MNTIKFSSSLTSFKLVRKNEDMFWVLQAKVVENTSIRTFPKQFNGDIDFNGAFGQTAAQDAWEKLIIPVQDYSLNYKMTFSDLVFDVKLHTITAIRKELKEGGWITEYTLDFICDPEKDMIKSIAWYVKHKEEDPDTGKKVIAMYDTVLDEPEPPQA